MAPYLIVLACSLAYGWLFRLAYETNYRPLPAKPVLLSFCIAGPASWLLASVCNAFFLGLARIEYGGADAFLAGVGAVATGSLIIGADEELLKFALALFLARTSNLFKHPPLALVFAASTALGFATVENLAYASEAGLAGSALRAVTATPVHLGAAAIWSVGLAKGKFLADDTYCKAAFRPLLLAAGAHGAYNFGCMALAGQRPELALCFAVGYGLVMLAVAYLCLKRLLAMHELRMTRVRQERCPACGKTPETRHSHCSHCGAPLGIGFGLIIRPPARRTCRDSASKSRQP